jgi:hypothetical protein
MSGTKLLGKIRKLEAITVERGASPAEAATAALLARRLIRQIARRSDSDITGRGARLRPLAPGVHVRTHRAPILP